MSPRSLLKRLIFHSLTYWISYPFCHGSSWVSHCLPLFARGPIVRESDGLAMSSRNVRLSAKGRKVAPEIFGALSRGREAFQRGEREAKELIKIIGDHLHRFPGIQIDYLRLVEEQGLSEVGQVKAGDRSIIAAYLEGVRLIDNLAF